MQVALADVVLAFRFVASLVDGLQVCFDVGGFAVCGQVVDDFPAGCSVLSEDHVPGSTGWLTRNW